MSDLIERTEIVRDHYDRIHGYKAPASFYRRHQRLINGLLTFLLVVGACDCLVQFIRLITWLTTLK